MPDMNDPDSGATPGLAFDYHPRSVRSTGLHEAAGWRLKRYAILHRDREVDPELDAAALAAAAERLPPSGEGPEHYGVGFVAVHRGASWDYVTIGFWAYQSELRLTGLMRASSDRVRLEPVAGNELSSDVWDLALLAHEREAWVRHALLPGRADLDAYLADTLDARM